MANNKFDIKVFTDELNKAFTILKKEQVLEKYMKNVLLNYNSIIYIGNITDEPNKYNTIYNYMYGEDNTLCNIVIFETDGFVDSESNIIPSGIHIAYPYLDYSVCIDYKYILNINNSAELLTPTQEYKTINNESILGNGNIAVQEPLVSGTNIKTVNEQSLVGSGNVSVQEPLVSGSNIKTVNGQTILGNGNVPVQEPLVSGTNIKTVNGNSLLGSGNIELSNDTVVIDLGTLSTNGGTLSPDILNKINNAISENKNIIFNINISSGNFVVSSYLYIQNNTLACFMPMDASEGVLTVIVIMITLTNGNYIVIPFPCLSSVNVKTVNEQSLIGSGNIAVQEPLVSGTNIKTVNGQTLLGSGNIEISGGSSKVLEKSITDIITSQEKILTIFNAMAAEPTSRTHTAISLDNSIPLSEFQNCDKIILDLSSLSSSGISGQLVFTKGFNTDSNGRAFYLIYMVGSITSFSIVNVVLATGSDGLTLNRLVVEQSGTATPLIDMDLANYYTKTEVDSAIEEVNNTIKIIECSPGAQLDADKLQKLQSGKYALYITGTMFYPTSDTKRFNTVPYFNYFGTSIQMCYKSVAINQANYLETISTYSIDLDIKKTTE